MRAMMNCDDFRAVLHEYLDDSLDAAVLDAAGEHLRQCGDCRRTVAREKVLARFLHQSLNHATAELSLRPGLRRNVLRALESSASRRNTRWVTLLRIFSSARLVPAAVGVFCIVILLLGALYYRQSMKSPLADAMPRNSRFELVIHVPIPTRIYVFRSQDDNVVDEITVSVGLGYAGFSKDKKNLPSHSTKPL